MARRLALLALLACAAARRPPPPAASDTSESDSLEPFFLWDDYDSRETTSPRPRLNKTSAKVILKGKVPKLKNVSHTYSDKKADLKSTTINIESHTNFLMTKRPPVMGMRPQFVELDGAYVWVDDANLVPVVVRTKPSTSTSTTTQRPRPPPRRTTTTRKPKSKPTKKSQTKKTTCPPKRSELLSTYFQDNKVKITPTKKQGKPGWFLGIISSIYDWISKSMFGPGTWFQKAKAKRPITTTTTTTTTTPAPTTQGSWFQNFLDSEENEDGYFVTQPNKKPAKKSLKKNYKGYQLLRAYPDSQWKVHEMLELQEEGLGSGLAWWTQPSLNGSTDILVPPDLLADVKDTLKSSEVDFDVVIWDLQKAINYENPQLSKKQRLELEQVRGHPMTWRRYHRYADILRYLEYLQHSFTDIVELIPLGRSSEGLPLIVVKISLPSNETYAKEANRREKKKWKLRSRMKPAVWVDGGAHAREWIAPAVATWMIHALVEGDKDSGTEYDVLRQADFYIMPVLNPDGYEHSHSSDRLWAKTRSRPADRPDDSLAGWLPWNWGSSNCVGVDPDRNWDYHWGKKDASRDPCADNYAGPHPFSEPETRAVSDFLSERRGQIKVFVSLHSYSQAWLLPSSHAHAPFADDGVLMEMGKLATAALADMYGTKYQIGTAEEIRQPASGMSHDWAKARAGIKFAYHVDLRDSFGSHGFLLPGSQIVSTARETWQAVKAIVDNLNYE